MSFAMADFSIVSSKPLICNIPPSRTAGTTVQGISVKCVKMAICWLPAWTDATPADPVPAPSLFPPISKPVHSCFCSHKTVLASSG